MTVADAEKTDVELLTAIMDDLPDSADFAEERRKYSLTRGDVMLIFRIAKIASNHQCPFEDLQESEAETIQSVAKNINRTQQIAAGILITGIVGAALSGIWVALKHFFLEWVQTGGHVK